MAYGLNSLDLGVELSLPVGRRDGWALLVDQEGLILRPAPTPRLFGRGEVPDPSLRARLETLDDQGYCSHHRDDYHFSFGDFRSLSPEDKSIFFGFCGWLPCSIQLHHHRSLGHPEFALEVRFSIGSRRVYPEVIGPLARIEGEFYLLPEDVWTLLEQIIALNSLSRDEKSVLDRILRSWASVAATADCVEAEKDQYLRDENVVVPEKVLLDVREDEEGRVSVVPTFESVDSAATHRAYLLENSITDVYHVEDSSGGRTRIVLTEEVRSVLEGIRLYRRLPPRERDRLFSRPQELLPDEVSASAVDMSLYGPRVRAIGEYPITIRPFVGERRDWTALGVEEGAAEGYGETKSRARGIALSITLADSTTVEEFFDSPGEAEELLADLDTAIRKRDPVVEFRGKRLPADQLLRMQLASCIERFTEENRLKPAKESSPIVGPVIWDNIQDREYEDQKSGRDEGSQQIRIPVAVKPGVQLKDHQHVGFRWLAETVQCGERGALLADDMGLGKTLQALVFVAWLIETDALKTDLSRSSGPWEPILIVAPAILLEVWRKEIEAFFDERSFLPYEIFDSGALRRIRNQEGKEGVVAKSVLDLSRLKQNRVVITNYEAVANYGFSFGQIHWTAVISDESHEFKEPSTRVSQVMKSLNTKFRLAMTGTPVVNRLLDVWNLVDFLRPLLIGSQKEFRDHFELRPEDGGIVEGARRLRDKLQVASRSPVTPASVVLRRSKEQELADLPRKVEKLITCSLSDQQRAAYVELIHADQGAGGQGRILKLLPTLNKLLQHPSLVAGSPDLLNPELLIDQSPKLRLMVEELRKVEARGEKALVFAIYINMQQILKRALDAEFGLDIKIINGDSSTTGDRVRRRRMETIEEFGNRRGFDVMILSPDVAGVGLTITSANHVFHFGRWWNPAREDQATDRTYRIGQMRDVFVYRLVARDPLGQFKTFDEHLDDLISERRSASEQFLMPSEMEAETARSISDKIMAGMANISERQAVALVDSQEGIDALSPAQFEALVATLWAAEGHEVYISPQAGDAGVDVVAVSDEDVWCIQAKHVARFGSPVDEAGVGQIRNGASHYMANLFPRTLRSRTLRTAVVTNGRSSRRLYSEAEKNGVQFVGGGELLKRLTAKGISVAAVCQREAERCSSMPELRSRLQSDYGVASPVRP